MSFDLFIKPKAEADLHSARNWYDLKKPGLGNEFIFCTEASLQAIQRTPKIYPELLAQVRRCLMPRFPYAIYYKIEDSKIVILAVLHTSRDANYHNKRSKEEE